MIKGCIIIKTLFNFYKQAHSKWEELGAELLWLEAEEENVEVALNLQTATPRG